jgi:hypothetical protein
MEIINEGSIHRITNGIAHHPLRGDIVSLMGQWRRLGGFRYRKYRDIPAPGRKPWESDWRGRR